MNLYTKCLKYESFRVFFHELNILKTYFWGVVTLVIIVYIKLYWFLLDYMQWRLSISTIFYNSEQLLQKAKNIYFCLWMLCNISGDVKE